MLRKSGFLGGIGVAMSVAALAACGSVEGAADAAGTADSDGGGGDEPTDAGADRICTPGEALRCEGNDLVTCSGDGTAEVTDDCPLGCDGGNARCIDVDASNGLNQFLDVTDEQADLDFSDPAEFDTSSGEVSVGGDLVDVEHFLVGDSDAPPQIRVFAVGSLRAQQVRVTGEHAAAIVSDGDIRLRGEFVVEPGAGTLTDADCRGGGIESLDCDSISCSTQSGGGGGGFATSGGGGGEATATDGSTASGGSGGGTVGNPALVPLRGGCAGGAQSGAGEGARGGGAVQLVSRTQIVVDAILNAPGEGDGPTGGGSGGAILLEAPAVVVPGNVTANGGGGGCYGGTGGDPQSGGTDDTPASGGNCDESEGQYDGGEGAVEGSGARDGDSAPQASGDTDLSYAGSGGGGLGRIRINTAEDGFDNSGLFSPSPRTSTLSTR